MHRSLVFMENVKIQLLHNKIMSAKVRHWILFIWLVVRNRHFSYTYRYRPYTQQGNRPEYVNPKLTWVQAIRSNFGNLEVNEGHNTKFNVRGRAIYQMKGIGETNTDLCIHVLCLCKF